MKKIKFIQFFLLLFFVSNCFSQINQWAWVNGDSTTEILPVYGIKGVTTSTNNPGGRSSAATWTDSNGNLWLFGGFRVLPIDGGYLNDLWKYSPSTNMWTWISGDSTVNQQGNYGIKGVVNASNKPGARSSATSWIANDGNLWLFGGEEYLNDLWKYDPLINQWTWISGDSVTNQPGVYGPLSVSNTSNKPGGRYGGLGWTDSLGNLWLFGGNGYSRSFYIISNIIAYSRGPLNDVWKFNPATNQWAWLKGDSTSGALPFYGIKGVANVANKPGARDKISGWQDNQGNFWLFGGAGNGANGYGSLNDLWKYNMNSNLWIWMSGDNIKDINGVYGNQGFISNSGKPGSRVGSVTWFDNAGNNLWLFGGYGNATIPGSIGVQGLLNDLWRYDISLNKWTWMKGENTLYNSGIYGTKGIFSPLNKPGVHYGSAVWVDNTGSFWLLGGTKLATVPNGFGYSNDLWRYIPGVNTAPTVTITSPLNNAVVAAGNNVILNAVASDIDGSITGVKFYNNGVEFLDDTTAPYGLNSNQVEPGNYLVTALAFDNSGDSAFSDTVHVTVTGCTGSGAITGEGYLNITGTQVADLIASPAYPNNPAVTIPLNVFEYSNVGDNYGARLRGYICAPLTGTYTFYIAGDDQAGLWLSTDENPANKTLIAYNETPVGFRAFTTFASQKSAPITLTKGVRYYVETLHKQSTTNNHLSVGWVLPNGAAEGPIPGSRLSPMGSSFPNVIEVSGVQAFASAMQSSTKVAGGLKVTATPNPTTTYFTINTVSSSDKSLTLKIIDALGRVVETKVNFAANGTIQIGSGLPAGIYFVEIMQGEQKQKLKLVKQ